MALRQQRSERVRINTAAMCVRDDGRVASSHLPPGVLLPCRLVRLGLLGGGGLQSVLDDLRENGLQVVLLVDLERGALVAALQVDAEGRDTADGLLEVDEVLGELAVGGVGPDGKGDDPLAAFPDALDGLVEGLAAS